MHTDPVFVTDDDPARARYVTYAEAAELIGVSASTIRVHVCSGRLQPCAVILSGRRPHKGFSRLDVLAYALDPGLYPNGPGGAARHAARRARLAPVLAEERDLCGAAAS